MDNDPGPANEAEEKAGRWVLQYCKDHGLEWDKLCGSGPRRSLPRVREEAAFPYVLGAS